MKNLLSVLQKDTSVFNAAALCLAASDVETKLRLTEEAAQAWRDGLLSCDTSDSTNDVEPIGEPGRPDKPTLVGFGNVPKRGLGTDKGRAALIHAVTHIEFNAINLAWDAVYRFRNLPIQFYSDWVKVADEEASHFRLLRKRLGDMGFDYGDLPAHNGLWEMAKLTAFDPMVRMALVPRVLEARGLDVTPLIIKRLQRVGDEKTVAALEIILHDEVGHVEIGSRWFKHFCKERDLNPEQTFRDLVAEHFVGRLRGPFHYEARQKAGFSAAELKALEGLKGGAR
ncbi:MAG: ferritin-like domain-containing protein [Leptospirales bacterium]